MGLKSWLGITSIGIAAATMSTAGGCDTSNPGIQRTKREAIAHRIAQKKRRAAKKARKVNRRCK